MHGRRLATTEEIIAINSPDSDHALSELREWTDDHGIELKLVEVGDEITDVYRPEKETLGITLGGDGTFLEGIRVFGPENVPILGVNTGTLAFLATVSPADLQDALSEIYRGSASVSDSQQLHVTGSGLDATGINDVMIEHVPPENPFDRKITSLQVFADGEYVGEYEGTGIAISTPTGSTGVSLSADGPIHYPKNNSTLQIVPLHTHRMGSRPIVLSSDVEIQVVPAAEATLLVDGGRSHTTLEENDVVTVTGAADPAYLVTTSYDDDFFTSVSEKLGWGLREGREDTGKRSVLRSEDSQPSSTPDFTRRARKIAMEAARSAGNPLRELHGNVEQITVKSDKSDIVTEADHKADNIITTAIRNEFPEHEIYSEESIRNDGDGTYTWMIDPLDGTGNFAHGNPNYCVSIALLEHGVPIVGVVYAPETDEMFSAISGEQAERNGQPISVTERDTLDESMLLSGYDPDGEFLKHCYQETRGVRRLGAAALHLCYLASGSADAIWEYDTYPWDVSAGVLIARTAGATITDLSNEEYRISKTDDRRELIATNGPLHEPLLEHLQANDQFRN